MENVTVPLLLDMDNKQLQQTVAVKQYDTARTLHITLTDGGKPYEISSECYAVFTALKPDGNIILNSCVITDNTVVYAFTAQTTAAAGIMPCEIRLYGADNALITSPKFFMRIGETVYDGSAADKVESSSEYTALSKLISQVNVFTNRTFQTECETGETGSAAAVERSYDEVSNTVTYKFTLPRGEKGVKGDKGDKGDKGETGAGGTPCTHSWNGTVLSVTSASGTSSSDLKGEKGDKGDGLTDADMTELKNTFVKKESGKGLSTNDYTTDEKTKLASLGNYTLPPASATVMGGIKVGDGLTADANGILSVKGAENTDTDCNDVVKTGVYYMTAVANNKPTDSNGWLTVNAFGDGASWVYQTFVTLGGDKYHRLKASGVWKPWVLENTYNMT